MTGAAPLELRLDAKSAFTLDRFSGEETAWPTWTTRAEGHFGMFGWLPNMEQAAAQPDYFTFDSLGPQSAQISRDLYNILIQRLDGRAFNIVRRHKGHGLAAWRDLVREYAGSEAGRRTALLRAILNPGEDWARASGQGKSFAEVLQAWELLQIEYENASGRRVQDDELVATVLEHAPPDIKSLFRSAHESVRSSYRGLHDHIMLITRSEKTYTLSTLVAQDAPVPMQIGGIQADTPSVNAASAVPCRMWALGKCRFGDRCRYSHSGPGGAPKGGPERQRQGQG